ncbi:MAG: rhodanese-like domain-containing protein [Flavobacteriales bacterium]|nr:rhodanese-like domain-containing protein [Flavobacteriales bacterium]
MKSITVEQLKTWKENNTPHQLIDVRELYEIETCTIGGLHIPMAEVMDRVAEINKDIPVIIHCKSGRRSEAVVYELERRFGLSNVYTLSGGIMAWIDAVDHSLMKY